MFVRFRPFRMLLAALIASMSVFSSGCESGETMSADAGAGDGAITGDGGGPMRELLCPEPTPPSCSDESILELQFFAEANDGLIENEADGEGFLTHVDATGGGFTPSKAYVYARFTDEGLVRVDVGDEAALESTEWDIAFRRFVIRLNSGVSGPSCVTAARTAAATEYDTLTAPPESLEYRTEEYFTPTCEFVPDGSGLESPGTALQSFWSYPGCVQMTGNVYVVRLANGRRLKLTVTAYYAPEAQEMCDSTGSAPTGPANGSGNIRFRWAFLEQ
jgi:hypothetical protein